MCERCRIETDRGMRGGEDDDEDKKEVDKLNQHKFWYDKYSIYYDAVMNPLKTNDININGFLNILWSAKKNNIKRIVYAASSSTYGDSKKLPKIENEIGSPLSPYAVTKYVNELYVQPIFRF